MIARHDKPHRFKIDDQEYTIVGAEVIEHEGRYVELQIYEATCAHPGCCRVFRYKTTKRNLKSKQINRRCPHHKAPGSPVVPRRAKAPKPIAAKPAAPPRGFAARQRALREAKLARRAALAASRGVLPSYLD